MARFDLDVLVLGGGAAGLTVAGTAANIGALTMLVERHRLGGDCTWTGCVPSKVLLHAAHLRAAAQTFADRYAADAPAAPAADFAAVMNRMRTIRQEVYDDADAPEIYEGFGIEVVQGDARFVDAHTVEIALADGGTRRVTARRIVLCTGGRAAPPPIPGLDATPFLTNETLFDLDAQPRRLAIIGAGPIGVEMGQTFARLGTEVTVIDMAERILGRDDADHAAMLRGALEAEGVRFLLGAAVAGVEPDGAGVRVRCTVGGAEQVVEADALLVATGRKPNVEGLGLEAAGVAYTRRGITVNERCRTSQRHIFAAGDCTGEYQLTHMSEHMAKVAATNAVLRVPMRMDRAGLTWTTFTSPEIAQLGSTEADLAAAGTRFVTYRFPYAKVDRAVTEESTTGHIKILATPLTGKILGASVVGERAGELISIFGVARKAGASVRTVADTIFPYPTYGLGARRAADQYYIQKQYPAFVKAVKAVFGYRGLTPPPPDPNRVM
jgi:pyruvate/2-oxoglutarate dehydrogenase complex dihydrolipoamide dehydrogenase (E3) component